jgi:hypothetical protein
MLGLDFFSTVSEYLVLYTRLSLSVSKTIFLLSFLTSFQVVQSDSNQYLSSKGNVCHLPFVIENKLLSSPTSSSKFILKNRALFETFVLSLNIGVSTMAHVSENSFIYASVLAKKLVLVRFFRVISLVG